jgi:hypothetical protein
LIEQSKRHRPWGDDAYDATILILDNKALIREWDCKRSFIVKNVLVFLGVFLFARRFLLFRFGLLFVFRFGLLFMGVNIIMKKIIVGIKIALDIGTIAIA